MKILCVAQVENDEYIREQIAKQTVQPDAVFIYVDQEPAQGIDNRRIRIAQNHQKLAEFVEDYKPDLVWQVEGDCELPDYCLERLINNYNVLKRKDGDNFGYVSGIQVGRHGLYCLGAWVNVTDTSFESLDHQLKGLQNVDATGFYCLLAERDVWLSGKVDWNGEPYGPDVVWGLSINKQKYCDMSLSIGHRIETGIIKPEHMSTCNAKFYKEGDKWSYKQL